MSENKKKYLLLIVNSGLNENKNKVISEVTLTFKKKPERFTRSLFK